MKYSEFWEYLRGTNFAREEDDEIIQVNMDDIMCVKISKNTHRQIILPYTVKNPEEFELIRKALELAETPLDKRREVKKYYIKHKFINNYNSLEYINIHTTEEIVLNDRHEDPPYKTKFTIAEIEELKEKFDTDLRDFEIIEAEED